MKKFKSLYELAEYAANFGVDARGYRFSDLSISKGIIKMPVEPCNGRGRVKCFQINVLEGGQKLLTGVLWHCLFGKPKVYHTMILFEILNRTEQYSLLAQTVYDVVVICNLTAKAGVTNEPFHHNLEPVRRTIPANQLQTMIDKLRSSGINLPHKSPDLDKILTVSKGTIFQRKPQPVNRVGVGYKDKGSLPKPGSEYEPDEITPFSAASNYKLWRVFASQFERVGYSFSKI